MRQSCKTRCHALVGQAWRRRPGPFNAMDTCPRVANTVRTDKATAHGEMVFAAAIFPAVCVDPTSCGTSYRGSAYGRRTCGSRQVPAIDEQARQRI